MKKLVMAMFLVLLLAACNVEETETTENTEEQEVTEEVDELKEEVIAEVNEVIADDEYVKVTVVDLVHKSGDERGERYNINIEVENKTDETLGVSTGEQSIDGKMQDELFYYAEDIAGGKSADTVVLIEDASGEGNLPTIEDNIEFTFDIDKDMELVKSYDVKIELE